MDEIPLVPASRIEENKHRDALWEEATRDIRAKMAAIEEPERKEIIKDYVDKYPPEIQDALAKSADERSPYECQMVAKAEL